jgi:hypothetical protein
MTDTPVPIPVVVGVAGHRAIDPGSIAAVSKAVRDILSQLKIEFGCALHVLTALAEGADQLVAEIAEELCISVIAVLPMPLGLYRTRIASGHLDKFDQSWERASLKLELPLVVGSGNTMNPAFDTLHYEQLGVFVARRSHILLALWEGPERADTTALPVQPGGTADVLRMRFDVQRVLPVYHHSHLFERAGSPLDAPHADPVLQIVTPRDHTGRQPPAFAGWTPPAGACFVLTDWSGVGRTQLASASEFSATINERAQLAFKQIKTANEHITRLPVTDQDTFSKQLSYLNTGNLHDIDGTPLAHLKALQAGVDTCAAGFQRRLLGYFGGKPPWEVVKLTLRSWVTPGPKARPGMLFAFTAGVPLAVLLFELNAVGHPHSVWQQAALLLAYLLLFLGMLYWHRRSEHHECQSHFQDYRALAEALRVQLFWAAAGLPIAASDNYLRKQAGELGWIEFALRGPALWGTALALRNPSPPRNIVISGWLADQRKYFIGADRRSGRAVEEQRAANRLKDAATGLFQAGLVIVGVLLLSLLPHFLEKWHFHWEFCVLDWLDWIHHTKIVHKSLDIGAALLFAIAAALAVSKNLRAYDAHAHNYQQMGNIFDRAMTVASGIPVPGDARHVAEHDSEFKQLIHELGREALSENAEWLMDHRDRPVEPGP